MARLLKALGCVSVEQFIDLCIQGCDKIAIIERMISIAEIFIAQEPKCEIRSGLYNSPSPTMLLNDETVCGPSLSSILSLVQRFKSNIAGRETPMEFLNKNFDSVVKTIISLVTLDGFKADPLNYISQMMHEERLLPNSFDVRRYYLFLHDRIQSSFKDIANGESVGKIMSGFAIYDPSAGWGCRLTATLIVHYLMLQRMKDSGNYSDELIDEFANSVSYIGFDTNTEMLPIYQQILDIFKSNFGLGDVAQFNMIDFCGDEATRVLAESRISCPHITVAFTSSPTVLEIYPHYNETLNRTGGCMNWDGFVTGFLLKVYSQLMRFTNVEIVFNFIDDCRITVGRKSINAMVCTKLVEYLADITNVEKKYLAWDCCCPKKLQDCSACKKSAAVDCGVCSECTKGFGCPKRINMCADCAMTAAGMRTVVVVRF